MLAATRFFHFAATTILFGLAAFPFYAYAAEEAPPRFALAGGSATLAFVSGALVLLLMSANMGGSLSSTFDPNVLSAVVTDTVFGRVWVVRLILAAVVMALALRPRPPRDRLLLVLSGLLLASIALTGHSALPGGVAGWLHRLADVIHLLAAGWWIGGLLALALVALNLGPHGDRILERFSGVGYAAVAAIVLTGLFKSVILVTAFGALVSTAYGWTLLVKLSLFAGMGAMALSNRFWITPALRRGDNPELWLSRLRRHVAVELALGVGVLGVVGVLGALSPPVSQ